MSSRLKVPFDDFCRHGIGEECPHGVCLSGAEGLLQKIPSRVSGEPQPFVDLHMLIFICRSSHVDLHLLMSIC